MSYSSRPGDRVWAAESADEHEVRLYGYGVYAGDHVRPDGHGPFGITRDEMAATIERITIPVAEYRERVNEKVASGVIPQQEADAMVTRYEEEAARPISDRVDDLFANPRIDLDDGGTVWGAQCWWGPEGVFDAWAAGRRVLTVAVPETEQAPRPV